MRNGKHPPRVESSHRGSELGASGAKTEHGGMVVIYKTAVTVSNESSIDQRQVVLRSGLRAGHIRRRSGNIKKSE